MKKRILFGILGLIMFMPFISLSQNSIKGQIKASDGNPVAGVNVQIAETFFKTVTNSAGEFEFTKLENGEYVVNVTYVN